MYNREYKTEYLTQMSSDKKRVRDVSLLFDKLGSFEEKAGVDFCKFNRQLAIEVAGQVLGRKHAYRATNLSILKNYTQWCLVNGLTDIDILDSVSIGDIKTYAGIKEETVPDIIYLQNIISIGLPEVEGEGGNKASTNTVCKLCILLIFSGLTSEEVFDLSKDNTIIYEHELKYRNKTIVINETIKEYIKRVSEMDQIVKVKGVRKRVGNREVNEGFYYVNIEKSDKLIRFSDKVTDKKRILSTYISNMNDRHKEVTGDEIKLSLERIYESGVYSRMLQKEMFSGNITNKMIGEAFGISTKNYTTPYSYHNRLQLIQSDYSVWKKEWFGR